MRRRMADAAVTAIVVSGALGRDVSWEDVARVWFYDIIWFVLTDLCKIPLTMSIENLFPPVPVTEAPVPDESDHVLAFGCVDLGYAYVRDTKENVRRRSSRRSSVDVEAPSGAAAFQPRSTKVQPKTVQNFGMLDGLFKKSEADVTETVYFDISIGGGAPQRVELGLYGDTRCINHDLHAIDATPARRRPTG